MRVIVPFGAIFSSGNDVPRPKTIVRCDQICAMNGGNDRRSEHPKKKYSASTFTACTVSIAHEGLRREALPGNTIVLAVIPERHTHRVHETRQPGDEKKRTDINCRGNRSYLALPRITRKPDQKWFELISPFPGPFSPLNKTGGVHSDSAGSHSSKTFSQQAEAKSRNQDGKEASGITKMIREIEGSCDRRGQGWQSRAQELDILRGWLQYVR